MTTSECEFGAGLGKSAVDYLYDFIIMATRLSPEEQKVWNKLCKEKRKSNKKDKFIKNIKNKKDTKVKNSIKKLLGNSLGMKIEYKIKHKVTINPELLTSDVEPLSAKEKEVLDLLLNGYGIEDISKKIFISLTTVKTHISNIYSKKQVHNLHQLCVKCFWEQWQKPIKPKKKEIKDIDYKSINKLLKIKI